ncbi:MAG: sensor histidine kinase [Ignavibacteria bacterium]
MSKKFSIDARVILQLGRDSIKDHTTALIELIKNSYDADAKIVEVEIYSRETKDIIRVADNGFGMTDTELEDNWLRIGFSEKKKNKNSTLGRRKTGEKGIGRIAADRLGSNLNMITKSKNEKVIGIEVKWDEFDVDKKVVTDIELIELENPTIKIPQKEDELSETGTEIIIKNLRQEWTKENINDLYRELSFFTPLSHDDSEFQIRLINDIDPSIPKEVKTAIYEVAEIEVTLHYDGKEELIYEYKNKIDARRNKIRIINRDQFMQSEYAGSLNTGPVDIKLLFFPRKAALLEGTSFKLSDLRTFLNINAGVKIYRDNIAVKPYGFVNSEFGFDWMGLGARKAEDPAGISRPSYKITPNQLVGFVNVSRDENPKINDSASREGLVENEAFEDLRALILSTIRLLETYRYEIIKETSKKPEKKPAHDSIHYITEKLNSVVNDLESVKQYLSKHKDYKGSSISNTVIRVNEAIEETERTIEELLEEKRVLSALATLGIASAVFGHETESSINEFKLAAKTSRSYLSKKNPDIEIALIELDKAIQHSKIISGWGTFALSRVEKEKRVKRERRIKPIINKVLDQIKPSLDGIGVELIKEIENVVAKTYPMDIESIILNLLTNAYSAVPNSKRNRVIKVTLKNEYINDKKGFSLTVSDSGPGVAKEFINSIWDPLFTTKIGKSDQRSGTGLGLTIVRSIVDEMEGEITLNKDEELKGAKFNIWLPK